MLSMSLGECEMLNPILLRVLFFIIGIILFLFLIGIVIFVLMASAYTIPAVEQVPMP